MNLKWNNTYIRISKSTERFFFCRLKEKTQTTPTWELNPGPAYCKATHWAAEYKPYKILFSDAIYLPVKFNSLN